MTWQKCLCGSVVTRCSKQVTEITGQVLRPTRASAGRGASEKTQIKQIKGTKYDTFDSRYFPTIIERAEWTTCGDRQAFYIRVFFCHLYIAFFPQRPTVTLPEAHAKVSVFAHSLIH